MDVINKTRFNMTLYDQTEYQVTFPSL